MVFILQKIPFVRKSYADYERMFNLELNSLSEEKRKKIKILDCPSGASSLVAECKMKRIEAYGCDPQYNNNNDDNIYRGNIKNIIAKYNFDYNFMI